MMAKKQCAEFTAYLLENVRDIPLIRIKSMDKKTERSILHSHKIESKKAFEVAKRSNDHLSAIFHALVATVIDFRACFLSLPVEMNSIALLLPIVAKSNA